MSCTTIDLTGSDDEGTSASAKKRSLLAHDNDGEAKRAKAPATTTPAARQPFSPVAVAAGPPSAIRQPQPMAAAPVTPAPAKVTPTPVPVRNYADDYIREYARLPSHISAGDTKKYFFLTPEDMLDIPYERGGWGSGQLRIYSTQEVRRYAVQKFGVDGLEAKITAQADKYAKKKMKEATAAAVAKALTSAPTAAAAVTPDVSATLKNVQKGIIQQIKQNLGKAENGGPFRVEVPGISKAVFAAMIKRPTDVELASVPKNGAFHTLNTTLETLLSVKSASEIKKSKYGTDFCADSDCVVKYKPAGMLLSISGYGSIDFYY